MIYNFFLIFIFTLNLYLRFFLKKKLREPMNRIADFLSFFFFFL